MTPLHVDLVSSSLRPTNHPTHPPLQIQDKFQLHLSDEEAETLLLRLIDQSVDAFAPVIMDFFHAAAQSRR
jgi:Mg2+ and Co2+ transporter CorA